MFVCNNNDDDGNRFKVNVVNVGFVSNQRIQTVNISHRTF